VVLISSFYSKWGRIVEKKVIAADLFVM